MLVIALAAGPSSGSPDEDNAAVVARFTRLSEALRPLFTPVGVPQPGDWLATHHEPGQSFAQYVTSNPVRPTATRSTLYILPVGSFSEGQEAVVQLTTEFMSLYFGVPVVTLPGEPETILPADAWRMHPEWGDRQARSSDLLDRILAPRLPPRAAALLAFTAFDLWSGNKGNFVFGHASLQERIGVWSIYRIGNPENSPQSQTFRRCLLRMMKIATHETGHMLGMQHCTVYLCNMAGCNSGDEADRHPVQLCPECVAKLCWATRSEPVQRYRRLAAFCATNRLEAECLLQASAGGGRRGCAEFPADERGPADVFPCFRKCEKGSGHLEPERSRW